MRCLDTRRRVEAALDHRRRRAVGALSLILLFSLAGAAPADRSTELTTPKPGTCQPAVVHTGQLQVSCGAGKPSRPLPLRHTEVQARVSGNIAHVTVEQHFENPYEQGIEAAYTFPLPHEAAVHDLEIRIGERIVRGEIRERQAAREIYEQAKRDGRIAALLDQERPNIFTQSIANIMPGHAIVVQIQYVEQLEYQDGGYELVFPTVVGPRFIPGNPIGSTITPAAGSQIRDIRWDTSVAHAQSGTGWAADTDRVPDASRITPPVLPPGLRSGHDIGITVRLDSGVPLQELRSENHAVDVKRHGQSSATVTLKPSDTVPNKDFILRYEVAGRGPEFGWLTYRDPSESPDGYFSLVLQPEQDVSANEARPKEMIFLIDASGSMSGEPMAKVKAAMRWALQNMNPDDTFQVIRFSESASPLAPRPLRNTPANVQRALAYIEQLRGQGGTHMRAGIEAALRAPADADRLRLVFFMTDGYIGNENEILNSVRSWVGEARLFAFGIGSSVNRFLLDRIAEEGRGVADYVSLQADTREIVERFYARIAKPYLTDIEIDWGDLEVGSLVPGRIPDLFAGQPLVVCGRYREPGRGTITVRGKLGRNDFERRIKVQLPKRAARNEEVATLWARRRIATLMSHMVQGEREELVREVTDLALRFRLVSRYTSFVAVDNQIVNADGQTMQVTQPVRMPVGVQYEGVFGSPARMNQPVHKLSAAARGPRSLAVQPLEESASLSLGVLHTAEKVEGRIRADGQPRATVPTAPTEVDVRLSAGQRIDSKDEDVGNEQRDHASILPLASGCEMSVRPARRRLALGDDVEVEIVVHNRGAAAIELPSSLDLRDGTLIARVHVNGTAIPMPRLWERTPGPTLRLAPGQSHTWRVTLNGPGRYAFAAPGAYAIELRVPVLGLAHAVRCTIEVR